MNTTTKHTPGPWSVGEYTDGNVTPHVEMVTVTAPKSKNFVTEICCFPAKGKGRANAALIASAPDLAARCERLEAENAALSGIVNEFLADQECMNEPYRNEAICERARAAIASTTPNPLYAAAPGNVKEVDIDNRFNVCMDCNEDGDLQIRVYPLTNGTPWDNPFVTFDVLESEVVQLENEMEG